MKFPLEGKQMIHRALRRKKWKTARFLRSEAELQTETPKLQALMIDSSLLLRRQMGNFRTHLCLFSSLSTFRSRSFVTISGSCPTISEEFDPKDRGCVMTCGTVDDARVVFDDMLHRHPLPSRFKFNRLFSAIARMKHHSTVISMSRELQFTGIGHDLHSLNMLLNCFCRCQTLGYAYSVLGKMFKFGLHPDVISFNSLVNGLCLNEKVAESVRLVDRMISLGCQPDLITYSTILNGLCKTEDNNGALKVFRRMEERGFHPNEARELFSEMVEKGIQPNVFTYNSLIHALCNADQKDEATNLLNQMVSKGLQPDVVTYTILVDSLCNEGRVLEAQGMVARM